MANTKMPGSVRMNGSRGPLTSNQSKGLRKGPNANLTGKGTHKQTNMSVRSSSRDVGAGCRTFRRGLPGPAGKK